MNFKKAPNLVTGLRFLVILETGLLVALMLARTRVTYIHRNTTSKPNPMEFGPLYAALKYESPDATFERLIKENRPWIPFRREGMSNTILSASAEAKRTNFVRILVANGADIDKAIEDERKMTNTEAEKLLEQVKAEGTK